MIDKSQKGSRRAVSKYYWDETTLSQRRRLRLQQLERENYASLPDFDSKILSTDPLNRTKKLGRPRTTASQTATQPTGSSTILINAADEGSKRVHRKQTQKIIHHKRTFADILAQETEGSGGSALMYLSCLSTPLRCQFGGNPVARPFCSVCGYRGLYVCVECGMRYCSLACRSTHSDTRCLKHVT